ncbi:CvpA family protein [Cellvibrio japonicus]|uniref:CvpA family protein n=1 Tax=Cellvibrio japonicus (strain Ueda107) TaxID=498211 RepID=B3PFP4_CELJU|nr:CvpA family protein [Cellvibrio japonicus]ACE84956.1 CvpA family protein [Cellvibrio japonicus Ueda107]QEI12269.1 CvpA family protein [Cellvibrio japonicus]QEI15843.1 CvpA family protein [Cellvibrio japonicus]QEI19421.1 CvpA family protein [Cellvibrio japonicus]
MNWADWAIIAIFSLSCLIGLIRGFVREALSLFIWVAAVLVARVFGGQLEVLLVGHIETPSVRLMTAYAVLFIATLLLGAMLSYLIGALVRATGLSGTDRLLGMVFGAARAFIIVMALLILLPGFLPVNQDDWWSQSQMIPHFLACEDWVRAAYGELSLWIQQWFGGVSSGQAI